MGNLVLLKQRATEEFERVKNLRKNTDRDYLVKNECNLPTSFVEFFICCRFCRKFYQYNPAMYPESIRLSFHILARCGY